MNKDLAIKISKHPMIKRLLESVDQKEVARLIVEEMMIDEANVTSAKSNLRNILTKITQIEDNVKKKKALGVYLTKLKENLGAYFTKYGQLNDEEKKEYDAKAKQMIALAEKFLKQTEQLISAAEKASTPQEKQKVAAAEKNVEASQEKEITDASTTDTGEAAQDKETAEEKPIVIPSNPFGNEEETSTASKAGPQPTEKTKGKPFLKKFSPEKEYKVKKRNELYKNIMGRKDGDTIKSIIQKIANVYKQFIENRLEENEGVDSLNTAFREIQKESQFKTIGEALGLSGEDLEKFSKQAPKQKYTKEEENTLLAILRLVQFPEYTGLLNYIKESVLSIVKSEEEPPAEKAAKDPEADTEKAADTDPEQPEAEKETTPSPEPEKLDVDDDTAKEYIKAVEELQNDFYRKRYKIQQAKIIKSVIDAIAKIARQEGKELSYQPVPKEKPEEKTPLQEEANEITADDKEIKDLRIAFRSFLSLVNKTKKALAKFEDEAGRGSVLARSSKKDFMNLLKRLQDTIAKLVGSIKQILDTPEEQLQEVTKEEMLNRWKEVQEAYDETISANSALKELLKGGGKASLEVDDIVNLAYSTALNLSQYFPSVNPFNKGAQSKADLTRYKDTFQSAIDDVKESLQYVVNIATRGVVNASSLAESSAALQEFSEKIKDIFGVEGPMSGPYNPKSEPAAEGESKQPDSEEEPLVYDDEGATLSEKQREVLNKFLNILSKDSLMNENIQKLKKQIGSDKTIQYMENSVMKAYNQMEESERSILDEMLENEEILNNIMQIIRKRYPLESRFFKQIEKRSAAQIATIFTNQLRDASNPPAKLAILLSVIGTKYPKKVADILANLDDERFRPVLGGIKTRAMIIALKLNKMSATIRNDLLSSVVKSLEDSNLIDMTSTEYDINKMLSYMDEEDRQIILNAIDDEDPELSYKLKNVNPMIQSIKNADTLEDKVEAVLAVHELKNREPEVQEAAVTMTAATVDSLSEEEKEKLKDEVFEEVGEEEKRAETEEAKKEVEEKKGFFASIFSGIGSFFDFGDKEDAEQEEQADQGEEQADQGEQANQGQQADQDQEQGQEGTVEEEKFYYYNDPDPYVRSRAGEFHKTKTEIRKEIEKKLKDSPEVDHWIYVPEVELFKALPNDEWLPQFSDLFDSSNKKDRTSTSDSADKEVAAYNPVDQEDARKYVIEQINEMSKDVPEIDPNQQKAARAFVNKFLKALHGNSLNENEDEISQEFPDHSKTIKQILSEMNEENREAFQQFRKNMKEADKYGEFINLMRSIIKGAPSPSKEVKDPMQEMIDLGIQERFVTGIKEYLSRGLREDPDLSDKVFQKILEYCKKLFGKGNDGEVSSKNSYVFILTMEKYFEKKLRPLLNKSRDIRSELQSIKRRLKDKDLEQPNDRKEKAEKETEINNKYPELEKLEFEDFDFIGEYKKRLEEENQDLEEPGANPEKEENTTDPYAAFDDDSGQNPQWFFRKWREKHNFTEKFFHKNFTPELLNMSLVEYLFDIVMIKLLGEVRKIKGYANVSESINEEADQEDLNLRSKNPFGRLATNFAEIWVEVYSKKFTKENVETTKVTLRDTNGEVREIDIAKLTESALEKNEDLKEELVKRFKPQKTGFFGLGKFKEGQLTIEELTKYIDDYYNKDWSDYHELYDLEPKLSEEESGLGSVEEQIANKLKPLIKEMLRRN